MKFPTEIYQIFKEIIEILSAIVNFFQVYI